MKSIRTKQQSHTRPPWRSLEQLADTWGLSRARTNLVLKALVRSGRMEERKRSQEQPERCEYRLTAP
jgi:DNA-binding HxlR family transcriptional regulator